MEDYKKKYKEALERAREQYNKRTPLYDIESIFPELKESEDERIKKQIRELLLDSPSNDLCRIGIDVEKTLAWLEKQDNKLDADKVIEWLKDNVEVRDIYDNPSDPNKVIKQFKKDFGL